MNKNNSNNNMMVLAVSVVIAFICFFFGFMKMNTKSDELDTKIASTNTVINQREEYKKNSEQYEEDTEKFKADKEVYLEKFPSKILSEDIVALVRDINRLDDGKDENVRIQITGGKVTAAQEAYSSKDSQIIGYVVEMNLDFDYSSYDGIKKLIDYINTYDNRCNVVSFEMSQASAQEVKKDEAFDVRYQLSGSVKFNMYFAMGTDEERYEAPKTDKYTFSVSNPFIVDINNQISSQINTTAGGNGKADNTSGTNTSGNTTGKKTTGN